MGNNTQNTLPSVLKNMLGEAGAHEVISVTAKLLDAAAEHRRRKAEKLQLEKGLSTEGPCPLLISRGGHG